jgi:hypothetical protein
MEYSLCVRTKVKHGHDKRLERGSANRRAPSVQVATPRAHPGRDDDDEHEQATNAREARHATDEDGAAASTGRVRRTRGGPPRGLRIANSITSRFPVQVV